MEGSLQRPPPRHGAGFLSGHRVKKCILKSTAPFPWEPLDEKVYAIYEAIHVNPNAHMLRRSVVEVPYVEAGGLQFEDLGGRGEVARAVACPKTLAGTWVIAQFLPLPSQTQTVESAGSPRPKLARAKKHFRRTGA